MDMIEILKLLRFLPLPILRALGAVLGVLLYLVLPSRRRTVQTNLSLCFPEWTDNERAQKVREVFVYFAQSFLDRSWLWHSPETLLRKRLKLVGSPEVLAGNEPTVIFAPHFVGMDVGWLAMNFFTPPRQYAGIYATQTSPLMAKWIYAGRSRHDDTHPEPRQFSHQEGVRPILKMLKEGVPLYVLPDMNYEPKDSLFVPFFGVPAATLPVLARYAKLGGANGKPTKIVPVVTRMTKTGYEIEVQAAWENYPSGYTELALMADTLRMNQEIERMVKTMPAQYYWVHRRFKDQPDGRSSPYV